MNDFDLYNSEIYGDIYCPMKSTIGLNEYEDDYQNSNVFYQPYQPQPSEGINFSTDFNASPLFEQPGKEEETEKEKINPVTESKQKTDNTTKKLEPNSVDSVEPVDVNFGETKEKRFLGRKTKGDTEKRKHDKFREDNKMRKIKSNFLNVIPDYVNSSLPQEHPKLLKISKKVNVELNIDYNRKLMKQTLAEIFSENPINGRYSKKNYSKKYNAELVKEIFEKNEETEAIEKLNKTYIEVLDNFRTNNLQQFKNDVLQKELKSGEDIKAANKYVDELESLLMGYERWFNEKTPRNKKYKN